MLKIYPLPDDSKLLSQKAKGIRLLANTPSMSYHATQYANVRGAKVLQSREDCLALQFVEGLDYFARPCPKHPRHGYVDSRIVRSNSDLLQICDEIEKAGEPIEILIVVALNAEYNSVVTPTSISIGMGNDGATSGRSVMIPTKLNFDNVYAAWYTAVDDADEHPYLEIVYAPSQHEKPQWVQMRSGPKIPLATRWTPRDQVVTEVLVAQEQDLLEWEAFIKEHKGKDGVVVWLNGKSPSSHYGVHAQACEIAWQQDQPVVGEKLLVANNGFPAPTKQDFQRLARYLGRIFRTAKGRSPMESLLESMAIAHNLNYMPWNPAMDKLRAYSIDVLIRITFALGMGEMRHWPSNMGKPMPEPLFNGLRRKRRGRSSWRIIDDRSMVYTKYNHANLKQIAELLPALEAGFRQKGWSKSFGGNTWANGVMAARKCLEAVCKFMINPDQANWTEIVCQLNLIASAVHNGGKFHNKLVSESALNIIADYPGYGLYNSPLVFTILYQLDALWEGGKGVRPIRIANTLLKALTVHQAMLDAVPKPLPSEVAKQLSSSDEDYEEEDTVVPPKIATPELFKSVCGQKDCSICNDWNKKKYASKWQEKNGLLKIHEIQGVFTDSNMLHLQIKASGAYPAWVTVSQHRLWGFAVELSLSNNDAKAFKTYFNKKLPSKSFTSNDVKYIPFNNSLFVSGNKIGLFDFDSKLFIGIGEVVG